MVQKQIQKTKQYTFEDICPDWTQIIADNKDLIGQYKSQDGTLRDISSCSVCIVGEAHG